MVRERNNNLPSISNEHFNLMGLPVENGSDLHPITLSIKTGKANILVVREEKALRELHLQNLVQHLLIALVETLVVRDLEGN